MARAEEASTLEPVSNRFTLWPIALGIAFMHGMYFIFDQWLDDSPGMSMFILFFGLPPVGIVGLLWLALSLRQLVSKNRWRRGVSWLLGPAVGVSVTLLMTQVGWPPWRVWFELERPYFLARVWAAPAQDGRKLVIFTQLDKELWSGHEKRLIIYDDVDQQWPAASTPSCTNRGDGAGTEWIKHTNLGFGFYVKQVLASYNVENCEL